MSKPKILFCSRVGYSEIFPRLTSDIYESYHAVLNVNEKYKVEQLGGLVVACFEEEYDNLEITTLPFPFLQSSLYADRSLGILNSVKRREVLGKMLTFWNKVFSNNKIDAIFHETIAIDFEEIMSLIAKDNGILDLTFVGSPFENYFFWKHNPYHTSFDKVHFDRAEPDYSKNQYVLDYINKVKYKGVKPYYLDNKSPRYKVGIFQTILSLLKLKIKDTFGLQKITDLSLVENDAIFNHGHKRYTIDWYAFLIDRYYTSKDSYDNFDDNKENNILFPLHFEPEATLLYFKPDLSEQNAVIRSILKYIPSNYTLFIKEHPQQPGALMRPEYFNIRSNNSNIKFIPAEYDSVLALESSEIVITICSSVGFEALIKNKPLIVLGNVYYDQHPDVYKLQHISELIEVFKVQPLKSSQDNNTVEFILKMFRFMGKGDPEKISLNFDNAIVQDVAESLSEVVKMKFNKI